MAVYALIENGIVTNNIIWDGVSEYSVPEGAELRPYEEDSVIGATWDGTKFTRPLPITEEVLPKPQPTLAELQAQLAALSAQIAALSANTSG